MKQSCQTCKFAQWDRTKTGRISRNPGRCTYNIELPLLPTSVCSWQVPKDINGWKGGIEPKDGATCPCHVPLPEET